MAAAALIRSVARKLARAPPQGYHRLLHERRLHSSTSPNPGASGSGSTPPTSDKDVIQILRIRLLFAKALAAAAGTAVVYLHFWALPEAKAQAYSRGKSSITHAIEKQLESILVEDVEVKRSSGTHSGHGGTRVDESEVDQILKAFPIMKEIADGIKEIEAINVNATEATIKDSQAAAAAELTALSEGGRKG